jgi:hypothetical protein
MLSLPTFKFTGRTGRPVERNTWGPFFPAIQEYHQNGATSIKSEIFVKKK